MKYILLASTILALVACKSTKEVSKETVAVKPKIERNVLFTANDEEQWSFSFFDDNTVTFVKHGDTVITNEVMARREQQDGMPNSYYQMSDEGGFYFEIENSSCIKNETQYQRSIVIFHNSESFQGCVEGKSDKTSYHDKWQLVDLPGLDKMRIYNMEVRPYIIINQEEKLINGSTGCNILNGTYTKTGKKTGFSRLMMTKRGCSDYALESEIVSRIEQASRMERKDVSLFFYTGDDVVLEYRLAE